MLFSAVSIVFDLCSIAHLSFNLKLKAEISRCEKLKFDNIQRFVEGMRKEIVEWWDKCFYSREQREQFTSYFNGKT